MPHKQRGPLHASHDGAAQAAQPCNTGCLPLHPAIGCGLCIHHACDGSHTLSVHTLSLPLFFALPAGPCIIHACARTAGLRMCVRNTLPSRPTWLASVARAVLFCGVGLTGSCCCSCCVDDHQNSTRPLCAAAGGGPMAAAAAVACS